MLPRLGLDEPEEGIRSTSPAQLDGRQKAGQVAGTSRSCGKCQRRSLVFGRGLLLSPRHSLNPFDELLSIPPAAPQSRWSALHGNCNYQLLESGSDQVSASTGNQAWAPRTKPSPVCHQHSHPGLNYKAARGLAAERQLLHSSAQISSVLMGCGERSGLAPWKGTGEAPRLWE